MVLTHLKVQPGESITVKGMVLLDAKSFALNMGRAGSDLALHFNPRFESHGDTRIIICNSLQGGEWGEEQREPDFPFQPGQDAQGSVLSADKCVPLGSCGCDYNGHYYKPSEEFWDDENCHSRCSCDSSLGTVVCRKTSCKAKERCSVVNGVRGCHTISYSTCIGTGDPHYTTFDGKKYDFMGTCIYQFAALCSEDPTLTPFNVKVENNNRGSKAVSFTKRVTLEVYNVTISLSQEHPRKIQERAEKENKGNQLLPPAN
ncbi:IgGFc-binding protein [Chelonia mydas]|uniref:Galectin n=1 Tax=Chelonia mydas TaxID=8469 RepID=M7BVD0_CHEMY|nr:IgGFc-binding protein [Chelonia mydas]